ncbi:MAG: phosphate ABC transporter permease subunit PstC [Polyangiaceae bacterium]
MTAPGASTMETSALASSAPPSARRGRFVDGTVRASLVASGVFVLAATILMIVFIARAGLRGIEAVGLLPLVAGTTWKPEADSFGGVPLVFGTIVTATGGVLVGAIPAVFAALWVTEFAGKFTKSGYRRVMEVAAAVPSVVYGWLALVHLVPGMDVLAHSLHGASGDVGGEGIAASGLLLGIMVAPTVLLLSLDALSRVPGSLRDASAALGATALQTAFRVSLPYAWRGLLVAVFFGFARAAGETMAVQMVIGGARRLPENLFSPTTTISTQIVMDMQNARPDTPASNALFSMSLILLVISVAVVLVTRALSRSGSAS